MQGGFPQSPCASSSPVTWGCCHFLQPITTDRRNSKASALRRSFLQSLTTVQSATSTTSRPGATQKLAVHNMSHAHAVTGHSGPSSHADRFRKAQGIVWRSKRHPVQGISDSNVRSRTDSACSCTPQSLLHSPASESPLDKVRSPFTSLARLSSVPSSTQFPQVGGLRSSESAGCCIFRWTSLTAESTRWRMQLRR